MQEKYLCKNLGVKRGAFARRGCIFGNLRTIHVLAMATIIYVSYHKPCILHEGIPGFAKSTDTIGLAAGSEGRTFSLEGCGRDRKAKQPGVDLWKERCSSSISLCCSISHS